MNRTLSYLLAMILIFEKVTSQSEPIGNLKSVLELVFELKEINSREDHDFELSDQELDGMCEKLIGVISSSEIESFNNLNQAQKELEKTELELENAKKYISNNNRQLMHDSNQILDYKGKRCFENQSFVNNLVSLKESLEKLDHLKANMAEYFKSKGLQFVQTFQQLATSTGHSEAFLELKSNYNLYSHPYEFDTAKRYSDDEKMTPEEATRNADKKGQKLEEDLEILINKIEENIYKSIEDIETREIQTANDFVMIEMDLQKQAAQFLDEIERKKLNIGKLKRDIESSQALAAISKQTWEDVQRAREAEEAYCRNIKNFSETEKRRIVHENESIEELIYMFKSHYPELTQYADLLESND